MGTKPVTYRSKKHVLSSRNLSPMPVFTRQKLCHLVPYVARATLCETFFGGRKNTVYSGDVLSFLSWTINDLTAVASTLSGKMRRNSS